MSLDPNRVKALFVAALDLPPGERAAFLARECGGDADLLRRAGDLLAAHDRAVGADATASLVDPAPIADPDATRLRPAPADPEAGVVIAGRYRLGEKVGEGGMGSVWVAHQTEPVKRRVAVKLIKAGMDSQQVVARFEAERQALAVMDHPNIAKVLDGGLHDGRPFFVMELVKGVPITTFCDERKFTPQQRLELFVPVCQAIQHAHQKGVIHRDIKPSNVLVALYDDKPIPKVIDFGVAKATGAALTERTLETGFGAVVGTPAYMSPEQASLNNLDIDTRSDVYSLGILLYELLTGSPPFTRRELEKKGALEMLRVVREEEPPRPSVKLSTADTLPSIAAVRGTDPKALTGLLRNELDWIVMKALEKERARRYETANGFAADVLRFLAGEPVHAHPPGAGYRLKKFARKHRVQVVAAGLVVSALVTGIAGTTWQAIRAETARAAEADQRLVAEGNEREAKAAEGRAKLATEAATAAERRTKLALDGADRLLDMQMETGRRVNRPLTPAETEYLDGLTAQFAALTSTETGASQAEAFTRLASVQSHLGLVTEMEESYAAAIRILGGQVVADPANANAHRVQVARVREKLARAHQFQLGRNASIYAGATFKLADADWQAAANADPQNPLPLTERARLLAQLSNQFSGDVALARSEVECLTKLLALKPREVEFHRQLSSAHARVLGGSVAQLASADQYIADVKAALNAAVRAVLACDGETPPALAPASTQYATVGPVGAQFHHAARFGQFIPLLLVERITGTVFVSGSDAGRLLGDLSAEELYRRAQLSAWAEVRHELRDSRHRPGVELLLKIGEAESAAITRAGGKRPIPPPSAAQRSRREALYAEALAMARRPDCALPPAFLQLRYQGKASVSDLDRRPESVTVEEYVWFRRIDGGYHSGQLGVADLRREFTDTPERPVSKVFRQRLITAYSDAAQAKGDSASPVILTALWRSAEAELGRYQSQVRHDDDYFSFISSLDLQLWFFCRKAQEVQDFATQDEVYTRRISLLEELPGKSVKWKVEKESLVTAYYDRANARLDSRHGADALADYQTTLKLLAESKEYQRANPELAPVAHFRSGVCLLQVGQYDKADAAFDEAIRLRRAEPSKLPSLPSGRPAVPWSALVAEFDRAAQNAVVGRWEESQRWAERALRTLDENGGVYPPADVKRLRGDLHLCRASALIGRKEFADAEKAVGEAEQFADARPVRLVLGIAYVKAGRPEDAFRQFKKLGDVKALAPDELYDLACGYALCAAVKGLPAAEAAAAKDMAMELLPKAVAAGWANVAHLKQDTDLAPLWGRDDFKKLVADLETKFPPQRETLPPPRADK